jgi:hypothetical protein
MTGAEMRGLLAETVQEIISRPMDILRCFWLTTIFYSAWLLLFFALFPGDTDVGSILELNGVVFVAFIVLLLVLFAITVAPGVIRWHRVLITNQPTHWLPLVPARSAILYTLLATLIFFLYVVISKILGSVYQDLLLPIIGFFNGGAVIPWIFDPYENPAFQVDELVMSFLAALVLGRLYMRLPEIAVEQSYKGARSTWTRSEKWRFYLALGLIFLIPVILDSASNFLWANIPEPAGYFVLLPVLMVLSSVCWIASVTLLSVAYRHNLGKLQGVQEGTTSIAQ